MERNRIMDGSQVSRAEIVSDLEYILEEVKSGKYPFISLSQGISVVEKKISEYLSESYQSGKQIMIVMRNNNGN